MSLSHVDVPDRLKALKRRVPTPAKAVVRRSARAWGTATASSRPLPDFLLIGTKRGGTTSLWNYLVGHPDVLPMFPRAQQIKSPHYFDIHYLRGEAWYRSHFPSERQRQRAAERTGARPVTGEASPYYVFHPAVPHRVRHAMPDVRLLVSLRNPVDRAYSNYNERRGSGVEPLATFEEALAAEETRLRGEAERVLADPGYYSPSHDSHSYLARGRYLEQLERWWALFPREQLHVVFQDRLDRDPGAVFGGVCDFLGIRRQDDRVFPRHNLLPSSSMSPETRRRLVDYYRPHNAALAQALGATLDWDR